MGPFFHVCGRLKATFRLSYTRVPLVLPTRWLVVLLFENARWYIVHFYVS